MGTTNIDFSEGPRVVVATAADLIYRVGVSFLGPSRLRTARSNAWAAVCADRQRASERDELRRLLVRGRG